MLNLIALILHLMRSDDKICKQESTYIKPEIKMGDENMMTTYPNYFLVKISLSHLLQKKDPPPAYWGPFLAEVGGHSKVIHTLNLTIFEAVYIRTKETTSQINIKVFQKSDTTTYT